MTALWEPLKEAHAIEAASAIIAFTEPLNDVLWRRTVRNAEELAPPSGLTNRSALSGIQLTIGANNVIAVAGPSAADGAGQLAGVKFQRLRITEDARGSIGQTIAEEFSIERGAISYRNMSYTRWNAFRAKLRDLAKPALEIAAQGAAVGSIRLEYRDVFLNSGEPAEADVGAVLRSASKYIAPHIFELRDLWHSHTGMFVSEPGVQRRLVQINVDSIDIANAPGTKPRRAVAITTGVQDNFDPAADSQLENPSKAADLVVERFESLHDYSKALLGQILTDTMIERIGLNKP
jgi:uncharacterized protein (TIGR04255 family)